MSVRSSKTLAPTPPTSSDGQGLPAGAGAHGAALIQVNLVVADMDRSVAFYRVLGLRDEPVPPEWAPHHRRMAQLGAGGVVFELDSRAFAPRWNAGYRPAESGGPVVLSFEVPTRRAVDEVHERLASGGSPSQQPPFDAFWGARYAVVEDPDGNAVGLTSPVDPALRRPVEPPPPRPDPET